jgi:predicted ABC-type transport system involved in lysophospholipase L1 biosynthesis ATPase subunit
VSAVASPVFGVDDLSKHYGGLRPLRVRSLTVASGATVALVGLDAPAAEMFVNLLTGASLPDSGEVRVFGRRTADITEADDWLQTIDRFGIVSDRAVLLDELTAAQNLSMPLTLEVDPLAAGTRQAVERIAQEAGLDAALLDRKVATLGPAEKLRIRLGRAVALDPEVLLLEHPTATLLPEAVAGCADAMVRLAKARGLTVLALTADASFAAALGGEAWTWKPADGSLAPLERAAWGRVKRLFGA